MDTVDQRIDARTPSTGAQLVSITPATQRLHPESLGVANLSTAESSTALSPLVIEAQELFVCQSEEQHNNERSAERPLAFSGQQTASKAFSSDHSRTIEGSASLKVQTSQGQEDLIYRSEEQHGFVKDGEPCSFRNFGNGTQHSPYNLPAPESTFSALERAAQYGVTPKLLAVVESVADCRNADEVIDMIQTQLTPCCSACRSFGLRETPADNWASREYNVEPGWPGGKLSIRRTQLLVSSAAGCVYCTMICKALSTLRPGWDIEDSFVELSVSPGLPVIVQWVNGKLIQAGNLTATIKYSDEAGNIEDDVEFEIYRPEQSQPADIHGMLFCLHLIQVAGLIYIRRLCKPGTSPSCEPHRYCQ